ncbi:Ig-like domain-containing protein [Gracilibacillus xinjiangensis]|uniref:Ig-like domain-containing protein n=1 Tax=Gracilibacillus xinjiangensis TaxID=1193282 RepID=A0ABV8WTY3_9BACI
MAWSEVKRTEYSVYDVVGPDGFYEENRYSGATSRNIRLYYYSTTESIRASFSYSGDGYSSSKLMNGAFVTYSDFQSGYDYRIRILYVRRDNYSGSPIQDEKFIATSGNLHPKPSSTGYTLNQSYTTNFGSSGNQASVYDSFFLILERQIQNTAPSTPGPFTSPASGTVLRGGDNYTIVWSSSSNAQGDSITYYLDRSLHGGGFVNVYNGANRSSQQVITSGKNYTSIQFRVRAYDGRGGFSSYRTSPVYTISHNADPTLTLNTEDGQTIYENDTFRINGEANDADNGNVFTVRYRIEGHTSNRAIDAKISDGVTPLVFNKELTFREGSLYDGNTLIAESLQANTSYTLVVFVEDDQGGKSIEQTRTFYVVPNRAPLLTFNPFTQQTDKINSDTITVSGEASDPDDGNTVKVSYRLNESNAIEIYNDLPGAWSFDLNIADLVEGENTIAVEAVDTYNFKVSKTVILNKAQNAAPLLKSVARYKIEPPTGSAKGVLLWIQREENLMIEAEISMTSSGEAESYQPMVLSNTAPINTGIVEDEFEFESVDPKENIVIKLTLTRPDDTTSEAITMITGVLD